MVLDTISLCVCSLFFKFNIAALVPFNNEERALHPSEVQARFLAGYISSSSPNAGASTFPYLHFHLFHGTPRRAVRRVVTFLRERRRLVARLATIKNALVRCAEKRAGAVFIGEMRYWRQGEKERKRNREMTERKREAGRRASLRQAARRDGEGYNLIRLPFGLIFE